MCLVALALGERRRFPLVIAANRDEWFARPTAPLAWWTPEGGGPAILAGRDLEAGGTWMGLTAAGRLALVTNVRDPARHRPDAPSRGHIVPQWLAGDESPDRFWAGIASRGHNGFNLVALDVARGHAFFASTDGQGLRTLGPGVHGLSNASLDTPWPKVVALKSRLAEALDDARSVEALAERLFEALADTREAPDALLPRTGVAPELERRLSSAFIRTPDGRYGTRSSMLVIAEAVEEGPANGVRIHVLERSFDPGVSSPPRRETLHAWPAPVAVAAAPA